MPSLRNLPMTLIIYDHQTNRLYADRHRHRVGESKPERVNKLIVPKKRDRIKFKAEDTGKREKILVTSGTGGLHNFGHAHWMMEHKGLTPEGVIEHFSDYLAGNSKGQKHSKALVFTDKRIHELQFLSGKVVIHEYGERRLFWGGGAATAELLDSVFDLTPMEILRAVSKATDDRISADFTVVQGLPSAELGHDILLHATAPWPDDIAQYETETPVHFREL